MSEPSRVSLPSALLAVSASVVRFFVLLIRGRIHQPRQHVGQRLDFANGAGARVCRETAVDQPRRDEPAVVVFEYRLWFKQSWVQKLYLRVSGVLITPFLAGLPGFVSKLWLTYDETAVYGGVYEWDGARRAELSAQVIQWILPGVAVPSSIAYQVIPNQNPDQYLAQPRSVISARPPESGNR